MLRVLSSSAVAEGTLTRRALTAAAAEDGLRIGIEKSRIGIVKIVQLDSRDLLADEAFDGGNLLDVFPSHDRKSITDTLRASGAADPVHVIFRMMRHIEVDNMADLRHVDTARGDIGGDHHLVTAVAKAIQRVLALALSSARMENRDGMSLLMELTHYPIGAVLGATENQDLIVVGAPEQFFQKFLFLFGIHRIQRVGYGRRGRAPLADFDLFGFIQCPFAKLVDVRRNRRREQHGLSITRAFFHYLAHVGHESHVQHSISFVEDQYFDFVEAQHATANLVKQTAWRRHHDIGAATQCLILFAGTPSTVQNYGWQVWK